LISGSNYSNDNFNEFIAESETKIDFIRNGIKRNSDQIIKTYKTGNYICKENGCNQQFKYLKPFRNHEKKHLIEKRLIQNQRVGQKSSSNEEDSNGLEDNSKGIFVCKWKSCKFKSDLSNQISEHIRSKHLKMKSLNSDKSNYKKQIWAHNKRRYSRWHSNGLLKFPKSSAKTKTESNKLIESEIPINNDIELIKNNNLTFSCKGLKSIRQVKSYNSNKSAQNIAQHINHVHTGLQLKCGQQNCLKVFRSRQSYRQHQNNHICGFGVAENLIEECSHEKIVQYTKRIKLNGKPFYRCKWKGCQAIYQYRSAIKTHIHNLHVCPNRINRKTNQNHNVVNEEKSETYHLESVANIRTISAENKKFVCKRSKCNAKFSVYSDLLKHQNVLCKFRKVYNTSKAMQMMAKKSNQRKKKYTNQSFISSRIQSKTLVDEYYETKSDNGVDYHFCKWNECQFKAKFLYRIKAHIQTEHFEMDIRLGDSYVRTTKNSIQTITKKSIGLRKNSKKTNENRNRSYIDFQNHYNSKNIEQNEQIQRISNGNEAINKCNSLPNSKVDKCMAIERVNGVNHHLCKWNECEP